VSFELKTAYKVVIINALKFALLSFPADFGLLGLILAIFYCDYADGESKDR
jgi:hypothetical protein